MKRGDEKKNQSIRIVQAWKEIKERKNVVGNEKIRNPHNPRRAEKSGRAREIEETWEITKSFEIAD